MEIIGLDLHERESQPSIKADDGSITDRRIATSRERFTAVFVADQHVEPALRGEERHALLRLRGPLRADLPG